ncbi:MAG: Hsp20/alpha crystallin family protein [Promethearchaeota archaeon]
MSIFNRERIKIKNLVRNWPFENIFDDFYIFHDFDDAFEDLDKSEGKHYSISYHYETGMDEPEINIRGNATEEDINRFLENTAKTFPKLKKKDKLLLSKNGEESSKKFTIEMPGIGKDDIEVKIVRKKVSVTGKKGNLSYKREFWLNFEPESYEISVDNGLIEVEFFNKKT